MAHAASGPAAAGAPFACISYLDDRVAWLSYRRRWPRPASDFPAGKQRLALRDDPAPAAQDLAPRSPERLVSDAIAGAGRSIAGSGPPLAKAPGSREGFPL